MMDYARAIGIAAAYSVAVPAVMVGVIAWTAARDVLERVRR